LKNKISFIIIILITLGFSQSPVQYLPQPAKNSFSLVIDRSGSMSGNAMSDAKKAVTHFIDEMRASDQANIIAFNSKVSVFANMGSSKSKLKSAVDRIAPGGATSLYDAIAKAAIHLSSENGARIIVFLTDGDDTGSKFSLKEIRGMNLSEGIFIYGIGLGSVNKKGLDDLVDVTGGKYYTSASSNDLYTIYDRVLNAYYKNHGNKLKSTASITIRSIPSNQIVVMDGKMVGNTPVKLDGLAPKEYDIQIQFDRGTWEQNVKAKKGQRAVIDARETDLGYNLYITSKPRGASVFLNGDYVGITSFGVTDFHVKKRFLRKDLKTKSYAEEFMIPLIPRGKHKLRILVVPDDDGPDMNWEYEIDFSVNDKERFLDVNLFKNKHIFQNGEMGKGGNDPFDELE
jgi:hypothetical protein